MGLIDAIPDSAILANASFQATDATAQQLGIHGTVNMVTDLFGVPRPGRFGWKAVHPDHAGFSEDAFYHELGFTNPVDPTETPMTNGQQFPPECQQAVSEPNDPAGSTNVLFRINAFAQFLAPAAPAAPTAQTQTGLTVFNSTGCGNCHVSTPYNTQSNFNVLTDYPPNFGGNGATIASPALSTKQLTPYSDFLGHDMGSALADGIPQGDFSGSQWRTTPLWGLTSVKGGGAMVPLIHDGRCTTIACAIQAHGGEAALVLRKFNQLSAADSADLLAFLEAL
jgi:CxxC motif-containing protein (DUF1111 family)